MKNKAQGKYKVFKISIVVIVIALMAVSISFYILNKQLSRINKVELPSNPKELGIDDTLLDAKNKQVQEQYINILLIGVDARDPDTYSRSDSMIIATIDKKHKKVKLTSLMRDMIVNMQGKGPMEGLNQDRLGHAYAYGKAPLLIKTVNENFKTNVTDYVKVDFFGLEKIIDAVGGVPINVKQEEIQYINGYMKEVAGIEKQNYTPVTKPGVQILNGKQAVGYSRIRYVGRSDFERTERQRTVLTEMFKKLVKTPPSDMPAVANSLLPYLETSLSNSEILSLGSYIVFNKINTVEQLRLPLDKYCYDVYPRNTYFLGWDVEPTLDALHKFIYEDDYQKFQVK